MANSVVFFDDRSVRRDARTLGGKGKNLMILTALGLNVPPGFVVPAAVFDDFISPIVSNIRATITCTDFSNRVSVTTASRRIKGYLSRIDIDRATQANIMSAAVKISGAKFAVRSSATAEDSKTNPFAGIAESVLNVDPSDIPINLKRVYSSLFSERALVYQNGRSIRSASMAVVVQKMVRVRAAGVMFTQNPISNDDNAVIESSFGLGDLVVRGRVTPDHFEVTYAGQILNRHIPRKTIELSNENTMVKIPKKIGVTSSISDDEVSELAKTSWTIKKYYGVDMDIEWAIDGNGMIYVLQARPLVI
ncbi:MAG: PEP/pyruvate-binding domain-containing protein [Nitrososphaerota archaeon]|nr:PEP/pyruvate-binding domain-containing protein [Nitrososphaerota archaeon]